MATFSIPSSSFPLEGDYAILWSTLATFDEGTYTILTKGNLPRGTYNASVTFKIPESAYGRYFVQFWQLARDPITLQFMVKPSLLLLPSSASPGTKIIMKGSGFPASDSGGIQIKNQSQYFSVTTNAKGSFSTTVTLPELNVGSYTLTATTARIGADSASATLEVLAKQATPPPSPPPEPSPPVNNNSNNHNGSTANNPVQNPVSPTKTKLSKPVIVSPRDDSFGIMGSQPVTFKWGKVSEPANVTYTLQVGENFSFDSNSHVIQKTGLTNNSLNMELEPGTYYWRVKAVDSAGDEGDWAYSPYPFQVGSFPIIPIIIGVVVIIVIWVFIRIFAALGRAHRHDGYY